MDKFSFIGLWDIYSGLLTGTQREITDLYFNKDLTVSEIAAEKGISRQAVSDCLKMCKKQLEEYEEKLRMFQRINEISLQVSLKVTGAEIWAEKFAAEHPEFSEDIQSLLKIIK